VTAKSDGAGRRPMLHLVPCTNALAPVSKPGGATPISILVTGVFEAAVFQGAMEDQVKNPTRGTSALDRTFAALETLFEVVKARAAEDQPPVVVAEAFENESSPQASVQVFVWPELPDPPPRCG
jgi:hypothetical protein